MQTNVLSKMLCILFCLIATSIPAMGQSGNYSVKGVLVDSLQTTRNLTPPSGFFLPSRLTNR